MFFCRLQYAQRLYTAGIERATHPDLCYAREWLKKVERALTDAKKDNDFIYHERIPEERSLASIAKAAVGMVSLSLKISIVTFFGHMHFVKICHIRWFIFANF